MFANTRLLKFVCLSYLNNLPLFLPLQLAGLSKLPPPSLKVLLLVDELEVDQLLPLLVPVQLLHLLLVDKHHKEDVVQLDENLLLHLLVSQPQPLSLVTSKVDVALLAAPPRLKSDD